MKFLGQLSKFIRRKFGLIAFIPLLIITLATHLPLNTPVLAQTSPPASSPQSSQPTDAVLTWNNIGLTATATEPAPRQLRSLAIVHAAIFDTANAINRRYKPYAVDITAPTDTSSEAAVAAAAHGVLTRLYPAQQSTLDTALSAALAKIEEGKPKADGINLGKIVAERFVALRSSDGADKLIDYQLVTDPGIWRPTPPAFLPPLLPHWERVVPFSFKSPDQFTTPPPLPLDSAVYARELNEVKQLGGKNSTVRTADQTAAAAWSPIAPAVIWNAAAQAAAKAKGNSLIENARLFALVNIAGVDAYIAGYQVKYKYKLWRPVTAIPNAAALGNPAISADPNWESLIVTPAHPDYISGHCVSAGAAERILQQFFGNDSVNVSILYPANVGVARRFTSFSQITKELIEARIWGGVHTRTADVQGDLLGKQVGNYTFSNILQPL